MKQYTKVYLDYFGYDISDFIPCEVCNAKSVDIHHIKARSIAKSKENDITNLMALCRKCHAEKGDKKQYREYLQNIHNQKLKTMSKQQTAVEWLKEKINNNLSAPMSIKFQEMFEQAKELERRQIIDANIEGMQFIPVDPNKYKEDAEQYYNDKYGQ